MNTVEVYLKILKDAQHFSKRVGEVPGVGLSSIRCSHNLDPSNKRTTLWKCCCICCYYYWSILALQPINCKQTKPNDTIYKTAILLSTNTFVAVCPYQYIIKSNDYSVGESKCKAHLFYSHAKFCSFTCE